MSPIQQMLLGVGAVATKTYVDDIFSTFLYTGNATARSINNGVDMSKGGITWIKSRSHTLNGNIFSSDLVDGSGTYGCLQTTDTDAAGYSNTGSNAMLTAFNNNGFSLGADGATYRVNGGTLSGSVPTYSSWSFRKAPGFFTIKEYSGSNSAQTLSHDLGCVPGLIIVKRTDSTGDWMVYHRSRGAGEYGKLNTTVAFGAGSPWNSTSPTSTTFTVEGNSGFVNQSGGTFIAYLFAGGESTNALARSVDFDGSGESLTIADSGDFNFGSGDLTMECWVNFDQTETGALIGQSENDWSSTSLLFYMDAGEVKIYAKNSSGSWIFTGTVLGTPPVGQWTHIAVTRSSNVFRFFLNGVQTYTATKTDTMANVSGPFGICYNSTLGGTHNCKISNVRVVKGTAVYTSSFKPPTAPLTNITNTKLLCCNNSSTTGSTVTPGTITANGNPTASTDSPFDDPAGFVFGDAEDQNVIKTGSFKGDGTSTGPNVFLGFEPQWVMIKSSSNADSWVMFDSMRGVVTGGGDQYLFANSNFGSTSTVEYIEFNSTGFTLKGGGSNFANTWDYIYVAIRRPDGYCGKLPELGTDVFAMDTGAGSSTIPNFDSGFPVDWAFSKDTNSTGNWYLSSRLIQGRYLHPNLTNQGAAGSFATFDSNVGWEKSGDGSDWQSWMWKRHAGFDVVAYDGNGAGDRQISHSMNNTVQMIWTKKRNATSEWMIWHKDLNGGGTNAVNRYVDFSQNYSSNTQIYGGASGTLPTSTHYTIGTDTTVNNSSSEYISMLFASSNDINGNPISKVGSYTGNGSASGQTITLGFQPRFLIFKAYNNYFWVLDTTRGWGSGNDKWLALDLAAAQDSSLDWGAPTSTGFTVPDDNGIWNGNGDTYLYYAHA